MSDPAQYSPNLRRWMLQNAGYEPGGGQTAGLGGSVTGSMGGEPAPGTVVDSGMMGPGAQAEQNSALAKFLAQKQMEDEHGTMPVQINGTN